MNIKKFIQSLIKSVDNGSGFLDLNETKRGYLRNYLRGIKTTNVNDIVDLYRKVNTWIGLTYNDKNKIKEEMKIRWDILMVNNEEPVDPSLESTNLNSATPSNKPKKKNEKKSDGGLSIQTIAIIIVVLVVVSVGAYFMVTGKK